MDMLDQDTIDFDDLRGNRTSDSPIHNPSILYICIDLCRFVFVFIYIAENVILNGLYRHAMFTLYYIYKHISTNIYKCIICISIVMVSSFPTKSKNGYLWLCKKLQQQICLN